ncbi:MAG: hypothetical protein KF716_24420 [Anaerolineae bacterium]|nr:hypothetical protein [Anaerolineae bacterium]
MMQNQPAPRRRRLRLGTVLLAAVTIPLALVTLLGLEPFPLLPEPFSSAAGTISRLLLDIVAITAAFSVFAGVVNLLRVHVSNVRRGGTGLYSLLTILTFLLIIVLHVVERFSVITVEGSTNPILTLTAMDSIQVATESALAGMVFFFLVYAAFRLMRRRVTLWSTLFVTTAIVVLIGYSPLPGLEFLSGFREWLLRVPVAAGTRGLLIGIALGTIAVSIRVLTGQDRTFRE